MLNLDGLEMIAVLVVMGLFIKVLEQFGLFEPVGGEGKSFEGRRGEGQISNCALMHVCVRCVCGVCDLFGVWAALSGVAECFGSLIVLFAHWRGYSRTMGQNSCPFHHRASALRGLTSQPWAGLGRRGEGWGLGY